MNSTRQETPLSYFTATDSYTIPEILRNARSKIDEMVKNSKAVKKNVNEKEDEDSAFLSHVNSCTGILEMAFNRLFSPVRCFFNLQGLFTTTNADQDIEQALSNSSLSPTLQLEGHVFNHSSSSEMNLFNNPPEFKSYQVQLDEEGSSVSVIEITLPYKKTIFEKWLAEKRDLNSLVLCEKCLDLLWIWSQNTRIILLTESSTTWSIKQWYRIFLSDLVLAGSLLIRHPFHWHPVVRRRLLRAMKHFKRLYEIIDKQESSYDDDCSMSVRNFVHPLQISTSVQQIDLNDSSSSSFSTFDTNKHSEIFSQDFEELGFSLDCQKKVNISGTKLNKDDIYDDLGMPTCKLTTHKKQETPTTRHKVRDQVFIKWIEFSRNLANKNNKDLVMRERQGPSGHREMFEDYMNHLTDKIGIPPDPCFKVEKVNKNIFTVASLSPTHQST